MVSLSFISPPTQVQLSPDRDVVQSAAHTSFFQLNGFPSGARARATGLGICRWHAPKRSPRVLHQKSGALPRGTLPLRRKASTLALITSIRSASPLTFRTKSLNDVSSKQVR